MNIRMWQRQDEPSLEYLRFEQTEHNIRFDGTIVLNLEGEPTRIAYRVEGIPDWHIRRVEIMQERAGVVSQLLLTVDDQHRWHRDDEVLNEFTNLTQVDLSVTPATNLLPIRSLNLAVGQSQTTAAVWIVFPELQLERLTQYYTKIDATHYHYAAPSIDFEAILEVDDVGFITKYGDLWQVILSG